MNQTREISITKTASAVAERKNLPRPLATRHRTLQIIFR